MKEDQKQCYRFLEVNNQQTITVTRGTIPVPSVDAAYMIDKTTGYIKLNKFTENSYEEFMEALGRTTKTGIASN